MKEKMVRALRWFLFLPVGLIGSALFSVIFLTFIYFFPWLEIFFMTWIALGIGSSVLFEFLSFKVAPRITVFSKWSVVFILFAFVIQYVFGHFLNLIYYINYESISIGESLIYLFKFLYPLTVSVAAFELAKKPIIDLNNQRKDK